MAVRRCARLQDHTAQARASRRSVHRGAARPRGHERRGVRARQPSARTRPDRRARRGGRRAPLVHERRRGGARSGRDARGAGGQPDRADSRRGRAPLAGTVEPTRRRERVRRASNGLGAESHRGRRRLVHHQVRLDSLLACLGAENPGRGCFTTRVGECRIGLEPLGRAVPDRNERHLPPADAGAPGRDHPNHQLGRESSADRTPLPVAVYLRQAEAASGVARQSQVVVATRRNQQKDRRGGPESRVSDHHRAAPSC